MRERQGESERKREGGRERERVEMVLLAKEETEKEKISKLFCSTLKSRHCIRKCGGKKKFEYIQAETKCPPPLSSFAPKKREKKKCYLTTR